MPNSLSRCVAPNGRDLPARDTFAMVLQRLILVCMLFGLAAPHCAAQFELPEILSNTRVVLPKPGIAGNRPAAGGFNATIEISNLFGVGYVGLDVTLDTTLGPLSADRLLTVRLTPIDRQMPAEHAMVVELPIAFEQGKRQVSVSRSFPKWTLGNTYRVEIIEDGVPLPDYQTEVGTLFPAYARKSPQTILTNEFRSNVLFLGTDPKHYPELPLDRFASDRVSINTYPAAWQTCQPEQVPVDWRRMRDVDCLVIDRDQLAEDQPNTLPNDKRNMIRDWVMMGGTLVVMRIDHSDELEELLGLSLTESQIFDDGFQATRHRIREQVLEDQQAIETSSEMMPFGSAQLTESERTIRRENERKAKQSIAQLNTEVDAFESTWKQAVLRRASVGTVIGLPADQLDTSLSLKLLQRMDGFRRSAMLERGVDPLMGDGRNRRWLIPGVAEPPVYTFMGVLTLFVLLVGPIAYRWTTRGHRSHLMFLIAPVLALLTTAAMFAYSIVADGFGTVTRVRQITWIDGASGDAAERTRSTLFAGISPAQGLKFEADAEVMVYPGSSQVGWDDLPSQVGEVRLRLTLGQNEQRFAPSALPSRTQSQFVSHRMRHGLGVVEMAELEPFDSGGKRPNQTTVAISSSLPFDLRELVLRSHDGRYWSADALPAGETVAAKGIIDIQAPSRLLGMLYNRYRAVGAVSEATGSRPGQSFRDLMLYVNRQINPGSSAVTDGSFETWLNSSMFVKGDLPPGMFVGVSRPSQDAIAVEGAEVVHSIRFVLGTIK
ncbi:hypothetical protein NHH03_07040 [Stieleria sp. TO1_6]|uniref:hypothetical protein n=1 Tax=Stieleria tagensis TaxID=2956795 RepID=UPI00209B6DCB|nr:hypothetical protein [Stieleria tagensis]MCO8121486.1 hypothetical protein [Stieleria tagensis]